jgi:hypothetical protein
VEVWPSENVFTGWLAASSRFEPALRFGLASDGNVVGISRWRWRIGKIADNWELAALCNQVHKFGAV